MKYANDSDDETEAAVRSLLRDLPPRPAPTGLESRVLRQLQTYRRVPGRHRVFAQWPWTARAGFVSICLALIAASLFQTRWSAVSESLLQRASGWALSWSYPDLERAIEDVVSSKWLYGAFATTALLYAALFGLSVAAYRALYLSAPRRQVIR